MWPSWGRSPRAASSRSHPLFVSPTLKDVRSLLADDDHHSPNPTGKRKPSVFHRVRVATSALRAFRPLPDPSPAATPKNIVVYFTSLRVVRKTFEDCRAVRSILRGLRLAVDERDLAMDPRFLSELKGILGRRQLGLPRIFIGGRYMGGADEIRQLHESGELTRYVEGTAPAATAGGACERCGGVGFVLCQSCNGSHKCYSDKGGGGFRRCGGCNENGLVRCELCCGGDTI